MKNLRRVTLIWTGILLMSLSCCAGTRERSQLKMGFPRQKVYGAGQDDAWAAVIQTLNQMGFIIQFMDMNLGVIRASDDIRRDRHSFFTGVAYLMEIRIREVAPGTTMILVEYPFRGLLHQGVNWDPDANFFEYVEAHMGVPRAFPPIRYPLRP